ncbi:MAG: hypothetical protein JZU47_10295 [Prolixibacteraceae bacterium]|jgi:hypothetical protein|nr:hypothetical protein [Prolixibacteraceae bacterium]
MISEYVKAVGQLQELFQVLADEGKITESQANSYNQYQKVLINFHSWVRNQTEGDLKVELPWNEPQFSQCWKLWMDYKKQQFQFTYKLIGEQGALKDLVELSGGNMEKAIAIVHQSIRKGWKSFYELQEQNSITKNLVDKRQVDYKNHLMNRLGF